jgi:hypothetical protein
VFESVEIYAVIYRTSCVQCNINQHVKETHYAHKADFRIVILRPELARMLRVLEHIMIIMMIFTVVSRLCFGSQSFENKSGCVITSLHKIPVFGLHLYSVPLL